MVPSTLGRLHDTPERGTGSGPFLTAYKELFPPRPSFLPKRARFHPEAVPCRAGVKGGTAGDTRGDLQLQQSPRKPPAEAETFDTAEVERQKCKQEEERV